MAHRKAAELLAGSVPLEKLVLSQKLAVQYKNNNLPHVKVRDKMREREAGSEPQSGDRVPYVLLDTGTRRRRLSKNQRISGGLGKTIFPWIMNIISQTSS